MATSLLIGFPLRRLLQSLPYLPYFPNDFCSHDQNIMRAINSGSFMVATPPSVGSVITSLHRQSSLLIQLDTTTENVCYATTSLEWMDKFGAHRNFLPWGSPSHLGLWLSNVFPISVLSPSPVALGLRKCQEWWWPKSPLRDGPLGESHAQLLSTSSIEYTDKCSKSSEHVGKPHDGLKYLSLILVQDSPIAVLLASQ